MLSHLLAAVLVAAATADPAWQTYEDPALTFRVDLPRTWKTSIDPFHIHVATSPKESSADPFIETLKVVSAELAPGNTLDGYYQGSLNVYASIWKVLEASDAVVDGARAKRVIIDQSIGSLRTRLLKYFVVSRSHVYVVTCASDAQGFDANLPVFEAALATFRILQAPKE